MNRYRFSLGDSTNGAVGFCATVKADSKEEALTILRYALASAIDGVSVALDMPALSHEVLFINTDHIISDAIEVVED